MKLCLNKHKLSDVRKTRGQLVAVSLGERRGTRWTAVQSIT